MTLWYAFNVLATIFLGFCHQGGVTGAVSAISSLEMSPRVTEATFVFSNTYMPPKFPLLLPAAPGDRELQEAPAQARLPELECCLIVEQR